MTNYSNNLYSKEDSCSSDESDGEEKEAQEVLFITQETHNDEHKSIDIDETDSEGECINDLIEDKRKQTQNKKIFGELKMKWKMNKKNLKKN